MARTTTTKPQINTKIVLNMRIARFAAFILWICGGANFNTVFLLCNIHFNAVDASLSIIFNFGAFSEVYNVSYNTPYARNMSISLLVLMGSTNIVLVPYAYHIRMYYITLLLANGKHTVISGYNFPVSRSARPIVANK